MSNNLHRSKSLYLQQHAGNPVHWQMWDNAVLEAAKAKNQLLIISIGYSSCHWCHVMEHESFEDEEVALLMNTHYTSIKVDREERPDIDARYMAAVQLMTGQGGWPLNCIALPDGTPVWGGTYFSKSDWLAALEQIATMYFDDPNTVIEYGNKLKSGLAEMVEVNKNPEKNSFSKSDLEDVLVPWMRSWDRQWGGMNRAPKFPMPSNYHYLLRYGVLSGHSEVQNYLHLSLERMSYGGLFDFVHGGFTRYATDRFWKVPHFEKMLYDNAQLLGLFASAQRHRPSKHYAAVLLQTKSFLEHWMQLNNGLFGAALDADSATPESIREEGGFYTWTQEELQDLDLWDTPLFKAYFDLGPNAKWEGKYILHRTQSDLEFSQEHGVPEEVLLEHVHQWRETLVNASQLRYSSHKKPALDPKALVCWNALVIQGFAQAHWALPDAGFDTAAIDLLETLWDNAFVNGELCHQIIESDAEGMAFLDDYSSLGNALVECYSLQADQKFLDRAAILGRLIKKKFPSTSELIFRPYSSEIQEAWQTHIEVEDNVIPSANAMCAHFFWRLGELLENTDYTDWAKEALHAMHPKVFRFGPSYSEWLSLALLEAYGQNEMVVCGPEGKSAAQQLTKESYAPTTPIYWSHRQNNHPLFIGRFTSEHTQFFLCQNRACGLPVQTVAEARELWSNQ